MMRQVGSMNWRGRVGAVLGLAANDLSHRDPSYLWPLPDTEGRSLIRMAVAFILCAVFALAFLASRHG